MSKTITQQADETLPYRPGCPLIRTWSRWTDGSVMHSDNVTTTHTGADGLTTLRTTPVNLGRDEGLRPPPGLRWVDTAALAPRE